VDERSVFRSLSVRRAKLHTSGLRANGTSGWRVMHPARVIFRSRAHLHPMPTAEIAVTAPRNRQRHQAGVRIRALRLARSGRMLLHAGCRRGLSTVKFRAGAFDCAPIVACPICKFRDGLEECLAKWAESVIDTRRDSREDCSHHKAISFQSAKRVREHSLRDALNHSFELVDSARIRVRRKVQKLVAGS
jgi:hypothetical protein